MSHQVWLLCSLSKKSSHSQRLLSCLISILSTVTLPYLCWTLFFTHPRLLARALHSFLPLVVLTALPFKLVYASNIINSQYVLWHPGTIRKDPMTSTINACASHDELHSQVCPLSRPDVLFCCFQDGVALCRTSPLA